MFRWLLTGGGVGVTSFAMLRCLRGTAAVPALSSLLGVGSFVAGFLLTEAWLVVACRLAATSSSSSSVDVPAPRRRDDVDAVVYLVCGVLHSVCGAAAFISASLYLALLATYPDRSAARLLLLLQYCTNHCITAVCLFYARQQYRQVLLSAY